LGFPSAFEDELFKRISTAIENPKTEIGKRADGDWADLVEDSKAGDPDRKHDERQDHAAMGWVA
jgi:hypothetical protein